MDKKAMEKLGYGLYLVTTACNGVDNGCISNSVLQVTTGEVKIVLALNKRNYTHDMIMESGVFNVSTLTEETSYSMVQRFGFLSGRDCEKFKDYPHVERAKNGVLYDTNTTNAYISAKVIDTIDVGSHTLFLAEVTDAKAFSNLPSATYAFYHANIKKPMHS